MSKPTLYGPIWHASMGGTYRGSASDMAEYADGDWVKLEDYEACAKQRDEAVEALRQWMLVESEMKSNNPCPDLALRYSYRQKAIELTRAILNQITGDKL